MRFGWVGFHAEGLPALEALLQNGAPIAGVITLTPERAARRSAAAAYQPLCRRYGQPLIEVSDINDEAGLDALRTLDADVVFVIGWSQILQPGALRLARTGMIGAHASLLPRNRGSAPINWALIRGETVTGNTLIWLDPEVDAGAIIDQAEFPITLHDTCASLYDRVAESNRDMLVRLLPRLLAGERPGRPQPPAVDPPLPRRRPADGVIDWRQPARSVYDLVRAVTRPYPGAFAMLDGRRWTVWQAALLPGPGRRAPAGEVVGPVLSPVDGACGQAVACGVGTLALLEVESEDGITLTGRHLASQRWAGMRWTAPHD